jgi:hypothetical protein
LKRACTMPMTNFRPSSRLAVPLSAPNIRIPCYSFGRGV